MRAVPLLVVGLCAVIQPPLFAQDYPTKPIRIVVPFSAGGPTDIVARIVGQGLMNAFGRPVVIDNRVGAGGVLGADIVAKAAPDGYTLLLCSSGPMVVSPGLQDKMPYDTLRDFSPITLVVDISYLLLVSPTSQTQSVKQLIALAQAKPGQLNYGSAGVGSATHLTTELFRSMAKINIVHVPYKGSAPATTDLIAGQLQFLFDPAPPAVPLVRAGKLKALGVSSAKRSAVMPDLPTISEAGVPGFQSSVWSGICAPAGTPRAIVAGLNKAIVGGISTAETRERFASLFADVAGGSSEEFRQFITSELQKWLTIIKESGARAN